MLEENAKHFLIFFVWSVKRSFSASLKYRKIERYFVIVIMALGEVEYNDIQRTFQKWHEELKGGKSNYEIERIKRGAISRLRKCKFDLKEIMFIKIDKSTLKKCGSFQKNFRNAD